MVKVDKGIIKTEIQSININLTRINLPKINHLVIECEKVLIDIYDNINLLKILDSITADLNLNVLNRIIHNFEPQGHSVVYILKESHLAVHSWPELGYLHFDLVTCGNKAFSIKSVNKIFENKLKPGKLKLIKINY